MGEKWRSSDGGAVYSPDVSKAGGTWGSEADIIDGEKQAASGILTSYGSMTYALVSSYIYLDLKPGDPRLTCCIKLVEG